MISSDSILFLIEGLGSSLLEITARGYYEVIPATKTQKVWDAVASQEALSKMTIDKVLAMGKAAWDAGGDDEEDGPNAGPTTLSDDALDDDDDDDDNIKERKEEVGEAEDGTHLVQLGDDALKRWVSALLLDEPYLRSTSPDDSEFG